MTEQFIVKHDDGSTFDDTRKSEMVSSVDLAIRRMFAHVTLEAVRISKVDDGISLKYDYVFFGGVKHTINVIIN